MPPIIPRDPEKDATEWRAQFEKMGQRNVQTMLLQWSGPLQMEARNWLAEKEREDHSRSEAERAEEIELARAAKEAALSANDIAREANEIARAASASAALSAEAARTNNKIAIAALAAAITAIIVSVIAILKHTS